MRRDQLRRSNKHNRLRRRTQSNWWLRWSNSRGFEGLKSLDRLLDWTLKLILRWRQVSSQCKTKRSRFLTNQWVRDLGQSKSSQFDRSISQHMCTALYLSCQWVQLCWWNYRKLSQFCRNHLMWRYLRYCNTKRRKRVNNWICLLLLRWRIAQSRRISKQVIPLAWCW